MRVVMIQAYRFMGAVASLALCSLLLSGCIFVGGQEPSCRPVDLCPPGAAPACGADGKTYTCEAQLTCLGITPKPSGETCTTGCSLKGCELFCAVFKQDAEGCLLCECEGPPKPKCTVVSCSNNIPPICTPDPPDPQVCPTCTCEGAR